MPNVASAESPRGCIWLTRRCRCRHRCFPAPLSIAPGRRRRRLGPRMLAIPLGLQRALLSEAQSLEDLRERERHRRRAEPDEHCSDAVCRGRGIGARIREPCHAREDRHDDRDPSDQAEGLLGPGGPQRGSWHRRSMTGLLRNLPHRSRSGRSHRRRLPVLDYGRGSVIGNESCGPRLAGGKLLVSHWNTFSASARRPDSVRVSLLRAIRSISTAFDMGRISRRLIQASGISPSASKACHTRPRWMSPHSPGSVPMRGITRATRTKSTADLSSSHE